MLAQLFFDVQQCRPDAFQQDEARAAYERGVQGIKAFWGGPDAYDHPTVTSHALVMRAVAREAETLLKEKGILPQNGG